MFINQILIIFNNHLTTMTKSYFIHKTKSQLLNQCRYYKVMSLIP
jgi:hypothetical protein